MLERHARYVPVMDGTTLLGVVSFHDVAKAVYEEQSFENRMLKSYIKDSPDAEASRASASLQAGTSVDRRQASQDEDRRPLRETRGVLALPRALRCAARSVSVGSVRSAATHDARRRPQRLADRLQHRLVAIGRLDEELRAAAARATRPRAGAARPRARRRATGR